MPYFVVHPGGQQFGPADIPLLNQWAAEGRLAPETEMIDVATGAHLFARDVNGLFFQTPYPTMGSPAGPPGPMVGTPLGGYSSPSSPRARATPGVTASYVASGIGIVVVCCSPILTILAGLIAIGLGLQARSVDPRRASGAISLGILTSLLGIGLAFGMNMLGHSMGGGAGLG